ncbi:bifunctional DNA primase/polymerase [Streptomyces tremellae]|uniref:DNA primase/polymerase bifunctional N-terminal domain-containing protein n=1 Tax=Streptomyces tremellae TaxID=1124239 RepID=A0ABP7EY27_9ACTN
MDQPLPIPQDLPGAAAAYAAAGICVFRVRPDKAPFANCPRCRPPSPTRPNPFYIEHRPEECRCTARTCHGFHAATTDVDLVRQWWAEQPDANIGAPCALNSWAVLDIDPRHGGDQSLAVLEQRVGILPGAVMQLTGGGGLHIVYRTPSVALPGTLGPGLDVKHNGYVLLAPSLHASGGRYRWSGDGRFRQPVTPWPAALTPWQRGAAA